MLRVKTKILPSKIHGIGLFADEEIPKGTLIWKFDKGLDCEIFIKDFECLPESIAKNYIWNMGFPYLTKYLWACDEATYTNHSDTPNTITKDDGLSQYAKTDIHINDEITQNYHELIVIDLEF